MTSKRKGGRWNTVRGYGGNVPTSKKPTVLPPPPPVCTPKATYKPKVLVDVATEDLKVLCDCTVKLVELRMANAPDLLVENFAPKLLHDLLTRLVMLKQLGQLGETEDLDANTGTE